MSSSSSPLNEAYKVFLEASKEGFDWDSYLAAAKKVEEELGEVLEEMEKAPSPFQKQALIEEIGDLFLACTCLARHCQVEPDEAILIGLKKFQKRFNHFKAYAKEHGISLQETPTSELSKLWKKLKS